MLLNVNFNIYLLGESCELEVTEQSSAVFLYDSSLGSGLECLRFFPISTLVRYENITDNTRYRIINELIINV